MNSISLWQQGVDAYRAGKGIHEAPPSRFDRFFDGQRQSWLNGWKWARDNVPKATGHWMIEDGSSSKDSKGVPMRKAVVGLGSVSGTGYSQNMPRTMTIPAHIPTAQEFLKSNRDACADGQWMAGYEALRDYLIKNYGS